VPLAGSAKIAQRFPAAPAVTSSAALRAKLPQVRVVFARARYTDRCGFRGTGKGWNLVQIFQHMHAKATRNRPRAQRKCLRQRLVDLEWT
jgi:hypothetical protein